MSKIRLLPDVVANQIAAGEVVERPASVAKELLENALDAGASAVEVEIEGGGKSLLRVRDDGEGMSRDDALLAFERHATSKISSVQDLQSIQTFGFRGEALASIASVSRITLLTKRHDEVTGTELDIHGGRIQKVRDAAFPGGTELTLRDLFFNVPARRKFLKSDTTESFHVTNLVTHYALANHARSFVLRNNGRETINVTPTATPRDRAYQLFSDRLLHEMTGVEFSRAGVSGHGFVSHPHIQRASRDGHYLFVNGRFVRDKLLSRAVTNAYKNLMPPGFYPAVMLFVEVDPEEVDVNVHPQKTEVRFRSPQVVLDVVSEGIRQVLGDRRPFAPFPNLGDAPALPKEPPMPEDIPEPTVFSTAGPTVVPPLARPSALSSLDRNFKSAFVNDAQKEHPAEVSEARHDEPRPTQPSAFFLREDAPPAPVPAVPAEADFQRERLAAILRERPRSACAGTHRRAHPFVAGESEMLRRDIRVLGQMHDSYVVATDARGLVLIDQHVAHERILFEQKVRELLAREVASQGLLVPETIDLTPGQAVIFEQVLPELEAAGFDCAQLAGRTVAIRAVPADLDPKEARALFTELLDTLEGERRTLSREYFLREMAASLACRAAIKINMNLTPEKMEWLIDALLECENPTNCPHGRPVILRFDMHDIERGFKRI